MSRKTQSHDEEHEHSEGKQVMDEYIKIIAELTSRITLLEANQSHSSEESSKTNVSRTIETIRQAVPTFCGKIDNRTLSEFIFKIESFFIYEEDIKIQLSFAILKLESAALVWWRARIGRPDSPTDWNTLKSELLRTFQTPSFRRKLENRLHSLRQEGSVTEYITEFNAVLCQLPTRQEETNVNDFLHSLTDEIRNAVTIYSGNTTSLFDLMNACIGQEANKSPEGNVAFAMNEKSINYKCSKCGEYGHLKQFCRKYTYRNTKKTNVTKKSENEKEQTPYDFIMFLPDVSLCASTNEGKTIIIDSGSCCHITPHKSDLIDYEIQKSTVQVANRTQVPVCGKGSMPLCIIFQTLQIV